MPAEALDAPLDALLDPSLTALLDAPVDFRDRGFPRAGAVPLRAVGEQGWNALEAPMSTPLLVLRQQALEHNLTEMAAFCTRHGVRLAPHGKTHMSPQLWAAQHAAGAWAVTVANAFQGEVYRRFGATRILVANELVTPADLDWLADARRAGCEVFVTVDAVRHVALLDHPRFAGLDPQPVLLELGAAGGRAGVRDADELQALAEAAQRSDAVRVAGIEGFEGAVPSGADRAAAVTAYLRDAASAARLLADAGILGEGSLLTFGGSACFGLVVAELAPVAKSLGAELVLRSGCVLTLDHGEYHDALADAALWPDAVAAPDLVEALELWGTVLSTPEPGLAILDFGRRDAPFDAGMPTPIVHARDGISTPLGEETRVDRLNDQHAFVHHAGALRIGDLVGCAVRHPCTAFDKWRLVPVVDDDYRVLSAIRTLF